MQNKELTPLVSESLATFKEIEETARKQLQQSSKNNTDSFATGNTLTGVSAYQNLADIQQNKRDALEKLANEPAIVRLVIEDEQGDKRTIYIARTSNLSLSSKTQFASYRSDIGRLAELPLGEEATITINNQQLRYFIIEKTSYIPKKDENGWDSTRTIYRHYDQKTLSIESLRALVALDDIDVSDELDLLLAQNTNAESVVVGISHQVRTAMGLRDQPILDQFQGEIFRLPLDSQMVILGPPGTGKTTTLIKRLGQKLDRESLDSNERNLIDQADKIRPHSSSWLMFTPSELLKHYLKEAFSRERVPAPDSQIRTWASYRNDIARNTLGILRSANGGRLTLKTDQEFTSQGVALDGRDWFSAFSLVHEQRLKRQLIDGLEIVNLATTAHEIDIKEKLSSLGVKWEMQSLVSIYHSLDQLEAEIKQELANSKAITDELLKKERNALYKKDKTVFQRLSGLLKDIKQVDDSEDEEAFDDDNLDNEPLHTQNDIQVAVNAYLSAVKSLARNRYLKRGFSKNSRSARIIEFLGEAQPTRDILVDIGRHISLQNGLRRFINSHKRYITDVVVSYLNFRKDKQFSTFYCDIEPLRDQICSTELDAIVLLMLKNTRNLMMQPYVKRSIDESKFNYLVNISELFRNQIMVDEATDFSILALACMANLTNIQTQSFFACGDFNQRITVTGIKNNAQLDWIFPNIKKHTIQTVYRQSRSLNAFAESLLRLQDGDITTLGKVSEESTHNGVLPVLKEMGDQQQIVQWLAERIKEVERSVQQLPTIAVLVNSEYEVKPLAELLSANLTDINLSAVACEEGKALGEGTDVRVFDIQHIKGLEFEAVFFIGIDSLAKDKPELFDRYFYVGATRAATYLGLACYESLPPHLEQLRGQFIDRWN